MILQVACCYLENIDDPEIKINLPHKVKVPIGRLNLPIGCLESDAQIIAEADLNAMTVEIENVGSGKTYLGETQLNLTGNMTLVHGDHLSLYDSGEIYIVKFFPPKPTPRKPLKREAEKFCEPPSEPKRPRDLWENINDQLLVYTPPNIESSTLIAGFGLVGTLVKQTNQSRNNTEWDCIFKNVPEKLKCLQKKGYKIVVFSDNVLTKNLRLESFKKKIKALLKQIGVPIQVFMCTCDGKMKKPLDGMWDSLLTRNDSRPINTCKSFYVGNLGGRKENWKKCAPADRSNADRLFAVNINIKFFTPEEYFCGCDVAPYNFPKFNPRERCKFNFACLACGRQEIIVMVGPPDSGKTWTCKKYLVPAGYVHITVNFVVEMLRSKRIIKEYLALGRSIVVDGINPSIAARLVYVLIAKKKCVRVRCFQMEVSREQLAHNKRFRELIEMKNNFAVDDRVLAYDLFYSKPELKEGFCQIVQVPFAPKFEDERLNVLYHKFLLPN